jgi:hypothetical protein
MEVVSRHHRAQEHQLQSAEGWRCQSFDGGHDAGQWGQHSGGPGRRWQLEIVCAERCHFAWQIPPLVLAREESIFEIGCSTSWNQRFMLSGSAGGATCLDG